MSFKQHNTVNNTNSPKMSIVSELFRHTFIDKDKQISSLAGSIVYDIFGNPEDSQVNLTYLNLFFIQSE